ncbi:MAG: hypoxanthine phosphoribosyltransferase [Rickettsiales bacterium]|nr:hypoxanthine phosphoribosyltransferase [Rickettsiales bacterium]
MSIKTLLSAEEIATRVDELAKEIADAKLGKPLLLVALLRGSFIFAADIARAFHRHGVELEFDFLGLSSYKDNTETSGDVIVTSDTTVAIEGRHVLIIDDILESGLSLTCAKGIMFERHAASVKTAVLLEKPGKRRVAINADFVGFEIEDQFVIGYGLDYAGKHRELPFVGVLETA